MGDWLSSAWDWYKQNREALVPLGTLLISLGTFIAGVVIAIAALRQARTAAKQANIAAEQASIAARRHNAQTDADRQRRITESYAKATEQLGSDKIEVRLGGIYTLERISKESPDDYWTVMETLTAFFSQGSPQESRQYAWGHLGIVGSDHRRCGRPDSPLEARHRRSAPRSRNGLAIGLASHQPSWWLPASN